MRDNRLIYPYERMDGLFTNYTKLKEVTELPKSNNKSTIYMNNELGKLVIDSINSSSETKIDFTKPINFIDFATIFLKDLLSESDQDYNISVNVFKSVNEGKKNFETYNDGKTIFMDLICKENKIYTNMNGDNIYKDFTEYISRTLCIVYIGNDIEEVGKHDFVVSGGDITVTGGLYVVWELGEEISTDTIFKKEILEEGKPTGTYKYYIYNGIEYIEISGNENSGIDYIIKEITIDLEEADKAESIEKYIESKLTFTNKEMEDSIKNPKPLMLIISWPDFFGNDYTLISISTSFPNISQIQSLNDNLVTIIIYKNIFFNLNITDIVFCMDIEVILNTDKSIKTTVTKAYRIDIIDGLFSDWSEDSTYESLGYKYKVHHYIEKYDPTAIANVYFSPEDSVSGNYAPFTKVDELGIYIWAKEKPSDGFITIRATIEVIY